jgi:nicotinate phosphoribosyltransferase
MSALDSPLLTDLYQLNMMAAYREHGLTETAVFELFVRKLPERRGFLMAAGLELAVRFLETLHFSAEDLNALRRMDLFPEAFLDGLADFRFTGDADALPEGTIFFPGEPLIRITAPLPQAQLVETRIINLMHFQSIVASKAARMVLAAPGAQLIDFGLRRAHGAEAGLLAARASYIAGFAGSATTLAGPLHGVPVFGTMAHSFVQAHDDETLAFEHFAHSRPKQLVLLIDTYDTERGARRVVELAPRLARQNIDVKGVRLDSGNLAAHAHAVRRILDDGGLASVRIFASGGLDETQLAALTQAGAPIDGYGVGTSLTTVSDAPALDCAYKLQEYAGVPRRKKSEGKATLPGRKQVWRRHDQKGRFAGDVVSTIDDAQAGVPLLVPVMRQGRRVDGLPTLEDARRHAARQLAALPPALARLEVEPYPVQMASALLRLAEACDERMARHAR